MNQRSQREIRKYLENEKHNTPNLDTVKVVLTGKFMFVNTCLKKKNDHK